jgi:hypothetical protein
MPQGAAPGTCTSAKGYPDRLRRVFLATGARLSWPVADFEIHMKPSLIGKTGPGSPGIQLLNEYPAGRWAPDVPAGFD